MKTLFQHYMDQKDLCERKGRKMRDGNLRTFYAKAAAGFEMKARKLSLEEGNKPYKNKTSGHSWFRQACRSLTISQGLEYPKSSTK